MQGSSNLSFKSSFFYIAQKLLCILKICTLLGNVKTSLLSGQSVIYGASNYQLTGISTLKRPVWM